MSFVTPIFDPDDLNRPNKTWLKHDLYTGPNGVGKYVPKVDDFVIGYLDGYWRVAQVDATGLSVLEPWSEPRQADDIAVDILLGGGPGTISESFRYYIDDRSVPASARIHAGCRAYGTDIIGFIVFKGTDISTETGEIISAHYDQSGNYVGPMIPTELVLMPDPNNLGVKVARPHFCNRPMADNEIVTAVAYYEGGRVASKNTLLTMNTAFVFSNNDDTDIITNLSLESALISDSDSRLIEYPVNVTNITHNLMAVISYRSGRIVKLPVDGNKVSLLGYNDFTASRLGQNVDLALQYRLDGDEYVNVGTGHITTDEYNGTHITKAYRLTTVEAVGAYSVTLYGYPRWVDAVNGYRMEYWLYNITRQVAHYVTPLVTADVASGVFDPTLYGTVQNLRLSINLASISAIYRPWTHVQNLEVVLLRPGSVQQLPNWVIRFVPGQSPAYGEGDIVARIHFVNVNMWEIDVSCGLSTQNEWLERIYYRSKPLFNQKNETMPPEPTHFILEFNGGNLIEKEIDEWNQVILANNTLDQGHILGVRFIRRTDDNDLQLSYCALPVYIV